MIFIRNLVQCLCGLLLAVAGSQAQCGDPLLVLPDDARADTISSPEQFFGFPIGSRHLRHDQVVSYWKHLAESSDRVHLIQYGKTHGQRPLLLAAISSPENVANLENIQKSRRRLTSGIYQANPDKDKLVMLMGYSVHGDEASAVNAAPLVAYHLASSTSEKVAEWLADGIYLIDPAFNPDGIDRFANWANENRGKFASNSALDREHVQPWPGGRTNYYWFDLNRDWLPAVHPESQGRLKIFHQWKPNVVLDFHEMGGSSTYFFQPGIPARNNPFSPARNLELTRRFAEEHRQRMDAAGELYFTEERFDDFYPGKGSTYPDLHGGVGILFEQGSTRGLKLKNEATDRHFRDTVANQVRTSLSSLETANAIRGELLEFQTSFYASALVAGRADTCTATILTGSASRIEAAGRLLRRHQIRIYQADSELLLDGATYPASNALIIPSAQPEYQFIRSLLEPAQDFRENIFYDVSTWHLPSAFDLDVHQVRTELPERWLTKAWLPAEQISEVQPQPAANSEALEAAAALAFSPLELGAPRLVAQLQRAGAVVHVASEEFASGSKTEMTSWPRGTFLVLKQPNAARWQHFTANLSNYARRTGVRIQPIASAMTPIGPDLGSTTTLVLPKCNPLLIVGDGTSAYAAGAIWHFLDTRMQQPATLVDADRFASLNLADFTCVILPEGSYSNWSKNESERLTDYVREGGTVIAIADSIRWLERMQVLDTQPRETPPAVGTLEEASGKSLDFAAASDERALESIAGAFFNSTVDLTHPLAYGFPDEQVPSFRDHTSRFIAPSNPYQVVAQLDSVLAGYVSSRNRKRLLGTASVWAQPMGRGNLILLGENPVFRGYVRSSERFLTNAILIGPALDVPSAPLSEQASGSSDGHGH